MLGEKPGVTCPVRLHQQPRPAAEQLRQQAVAEVFAVPGTRLSTAQSRTYGTQMSPFILPLTDLTISERDEIIG